MLLVYKGISGGAAPLEYPGNRVLGWAVHFTVITVHVSPLVLSLCSPSALAHVAEQLAHFSVVAGQQYEAVC